MLAIAMPETVIDVLGKDAARDLENWLQTQFAAIQQARLPISAFVARQKVNVLMLDQVSNLLLAGDPTLETDSDGSLVWRVPLFLTMPRRGSLGQVGEILVDANNGALLYDDATLTNIVATCERLTV